MRLRAAEVSVLLAIVAGGAFTLYQLGSGVFLCGKSYAGPEVKLWMALAALQSLMFVGAAIWDKLRQLYRLAQYFTLPLAAIPLAQLALAYPRIFVCLGLLGAAYWFALWMPATLPARERAGRPPIAIGSAAAETVIFLMATTVIHAAIAFFVLHSPGMLLDDTKFVAIGAASAVIAALLVRRDSPVGPLSLAQVPPLALLAVVLLRAKFPDGAYDSLFYKATLPIMIADWRTAITGAIDHSLLGTDFQEIINAQLRILDPAYPPALTAAFAFIALWVVVPLACASLMPRSLGSAYVLARNVSALLLVSISEPLIAAGTAYHEPMLALLMAAALLPMSLAWLFLGAAVAVKATVVFLVPLLIVAKAWSTRGLDEDRRIKPAVASLLGELGERIRARPVVLAACLALGAVTAGEQFYRNVAYTGRLTGISDMASGLTDPDRRVMVDQVHNPFADAMPRGFRERYVNTFVHVLTLDRWIKPTEFGFHIIPTSRWMAIAVVLFAMVLAFPGLRRDRLLPISFGAWLLGALAMLQLVTQGRHLFPLSFGAALLAAFLAAKLAKDAQDAGRRLVPVMLALAVAFVAIGDQLVGSLVNNGWDCRRNIGTGVVRNNYDQPETPIERSLARIVAKYRATSASRDVVPTVLCENTVDRFRYIGAHYSYAYMSLDLTLRRLAARPDLGKSLPTSVLAVCFSSPGFADLVLPAALREQFDEVESVKTDHAGPVRILVSRPLMAGARATSLVIDRTASLGWLSAGAISGDLLPLWGPERLTNMSPVDAPGGKGAYVTEAGGKRVGVLIAPFGVSFEDVDFDAGRRLAIEVAMPYSNSDGMGVEFSFESHGQAPARESITVAVKPKPGAAAEPAWEAQVIEVPAAITGRGRLTVSATSPSGNSAADWVYFRQLTLSRRAR